eukprot:Awhi_evm1s4104
MSLPLAILASRSWQINKIGKDGAYDIEKSLLINKSLTSLDLSGNNLGESGAARVLASLPDNRTLLSISLAKNKIGDGGGSALRTIAELLVENVTLSKTLDLTSNYFSKSCTLKKILKYNTSIETLDFSYNDFSDYGALDITNGLRKNKSLLVFNLSDNEFKDSEKAAEGIAEVLEENKSLRSFYLVRDFTDLELTKIKVRNTSSARGHGVNLADDEGTQLKRQRWQLQLQQQQLQQYQRQLKHQQQQSNQHQQQLQGPKEQLQERKEQLQEQSQQLP